MSGDCSFDLDRDQGLSLRSSHLSPLLHFSTLGGWYVFVLCISSFQCGGVSLLPLSSSDSEPDLMPGGVWYLIVPRPLIFRPDLVTVGLSWSMKGTMFSWSALSFSLGECESGTDMFGFASGTGASLRNRNRFSGTGGISSGRTTGFSRRTLCSLSPSSSFTCASAGLFRSEGMVSLCLSLLLDSLLLLFECLLLEAFFLLWCRYFSLGSASDSSEE